MMKKTYILPQAMIENVSCSDILTTSGLALELDFSSLEFKDGGL